jgi:hypothetical protein
MKAMRWIPTLAGCAMTLAPVPEAAAQAARRELVGVVRDQNGAAVEGATVEIRGASARTDVKGTFQLFTGNVDTVTISIHRVGYSGLEALLTARNRQWDTVVVEMERSAQRLATVDVKEEMTRKALGLRDFDERRSKGNGVFITRADILARNTARLSDVLQTRRGINLVRLGFGRFGVRFISYTGGRGNGCTPDMWVDGARARGMEIDDILANTVEAMELYDSFAIVPFEFTHQSTTVPCGTIVVWTRVPNKPDKPPDQPGKPDKPVKPDA